MRATLRVTREDFDRLHERLEETIAAVERLQQDYGIQVQRTADLQSAIDRLVQHVQALTTALGKPRESSVLRQSRWGVDLCARVGWQSNPFDPADTRRFRETGH